MIMNQAFGKNNNNNVGCGSKYSKYNIFIEQFAFFSLDNYGISNSDSDSDIW